MLTETDAPSVTLDSKWGGAKGFFGAGLFLLREGLVEMDVPTRQSYLVALVEPHERTAATGVTVVVGLPCLQRGKRHARRSSLAMSPASLLSEGGLSSLYIPALASVASMRMPRTWT